MSYRSVEACRVENEVKNSRFIGISAHVESEDELFSELKKIRKEFSDATHVCYASVFDKSGTAARFSDDGEPGGTAGQPILEAIKALGLRETLVAVVRYFGGIKLGAGGLVRAYSAAASAVLSAADKPLFTLMDEYELTTDFSRAKKFSASAERAGIAITATEYSERVKFTVAVASGDDPSARINDLLGERAALTHIGTKYIKSTEKEQ